MPMRTAVLITNPRWQMLVRSKLTSGYYRLSGMCHQPLTLAISVGSALTLHDAISSP